MSYQPKCKCCGYGTVHPEHFFHTKRQDTKSDGWKRLLDLVEEAASDEREKFAPFDKDIDLDDARHIVTLPPTIKKLKAVKCLSLYGTFVVRIPPEIGEMTDLVFFDPYTSHRLHWLPYEITRCTNLRASRVSTRKLYGNFKHRPPFPALPVDLDTLTAILDADKVSGSSCAVKCSVCGNDCSASEMIQVWISLWVGTDVMPLLVKACSQTCINALPAPHPNYVQVPHAGGLGVTQQPPTVVEVS